MRTTSEVQERQASTRARERIEGPCAMVPRLEESVHDLAALARLARAL